MNIAVIIATYGDSSWAELAIDRAYPSALAEVADTNQVMLNHKAGATLAQARNGAASFVTADWLCFLDADDELELGYLDAMERALKTHRIRHAPVAESRSYFDPPNVLLVPKVRRVWPNTVQTPPATPNAGKWPKVNECVIGTLVRRDLFEKVGGFREHTSDGTPIPMYEDWDLWLRCWNAGAPLVHTGAVYREHVSEKGRNTNAHLAQTVYDAIWADHLRESQERGESFA